ncbi:hypothetical protein [Homoserinimonas sp. OAct 916]|uniref:hypothetical protein n=1 Tax=Homoserinimonas sp. OAct 916 TaxID=2211450 RepID=UPI000DBEA812|nr:hypothetical protein [Homoserinimonas sp. OAct 916]
MSSTDTSLTPVCSRAGCRDGAHWRVEWRNPKIHNADRVKVWLACDEHREFLHDYLATRQFPVAVVPLVAADQAEGG